jgi:hypothetical protein
MLYLMSYNLKDGRDCEYVAWVKKNKKSIQDHAPPGWKYRGTYGTVLGFGRFGFTDIWEMMTYGDFDTLRNWEDKIFIRLSAEQMDFFLPGPVESTLLGDVSDVVFLEHKKPKRTKK